MSTPQENAEDLLQQTQTPDPAMKATTAAEELPKVNDRIYLKIPMRDPVEMVVVSVGKEKNLATGKNDTAILFHDQSKLYVSDFKKDGYSWAPVPADPESIDHNPAIERKDEKK